MNHSDKLLVTGAAGFIGFHVAERLLRDGLHIVGLDNLHDYYDVALKAGRLARLTLGANICRCSPETRLPFYADVGVRSFVAWLCGNKGF
jgi:nucleoside-diphosphate-sugar epimerase